MPSGRPRAFWGIEHTIRVSGRAEHSRVASFAVGGLAIELDADHWFGRSFSLLIPNATESNSFHVRRTKSADGICRSRCLLSLVPCISGWVTELEIKTARHGGRSCNIDTTKGPSGLLRPDSAWTVKSKRDAGMRIAENFDRGALVVIAITLILFVGALFTKGLSHDLLLEAGVFLVSVKLIMMAYGNNKATKELDGRLSEIQQTLDRLESQREASDLK